MSVYEYTENNQTLLNRMGIVEDSPTNVALCLTASYAAYNLHSPLLQNVRIFSYEPKLWSKVSHLVVRLTAYNLHTIPVLLSSCLLQLIGSKKTHPVGVGAVLALRWGHKGGCNQQNLQNRESIKCC